MGSDQSPTTKLPMYNATNSGTGDLNITRPQIDLDLLKKLEIITLSVVFVLAVVGNGIVVAFLLCRRKKLSRMNLFIVHLSVADLAVAIFTILSQLVPLIVHPRGHIKVYSDVFCRLYAYAQMVPLFASSYMLVIIAVDRFYAICRPLSNYSWTKTRSYLMIGGVWFISLVFAIPQLCLFYHDEQRERCYDMFTSVWWDDPRPYQAYVLSTMMLSYIIPLIIQTGLYGAIVKAIWTNASYKSAVEKAEKRGKRHRQRRQNDNVVAPRTHSTRSVSKAKIKTVTMTFVVILAFILCWTPYWVSMVLWAFHQDSYGSIIAKVVVLLSTLNSSTNPFIYLFFNLQLVIRVLPCWSRSSHRRMASESGSMTMSTKINSSFSINRGSMSLTVIQGTGSDNALSGRRGSNPATELLSMRRYSPNGDVIYTENIKPGAKNGDVTKDHHVSFIDGNSGEATEDGGFRNTGYHNC